MTYSYTWSNAEQSILRREDSDGNIAWVPTDPTNRDYVAFLGSGETPGDYVSPSAPPEPTPAEGLAESEEAVEKP